MSEFNLRFYDWFVVDTRDITMEFLKSNEAEGQLFPEIRPFTLLRCTV
jgi:hypothetical protein